MNLDRLIAQFRRLSGDNVETYFFDDELLTEFANLAETEAAIRAKLLYDSKDITLTVGDPVYSLSPEIFSVARAILIDSDSKKTTLEIIDRQSLDHKDSIWQEAADAKPKYVVVDESSIELSPAPSIAYTLRISYFRTPLTEMSSGSDEPEINARHHDGLVYWMLHLALQANDYDSMNLKISEDSEQKFIKRFGIRLDANVMRKQARRGYHGVKSIKF